MAKHSSTDNIANHSNTGKIANVSNTDRDEISILYIGPSIDASYQVAVHFAKRFQRRIFLLEINQSETRISCSSHVC
jgi:hypothetical protein